MCNDRPRQNPLTPKTISFNYATVGITFISPTGYSNPTISSMNCKPQLVIGKNAIPLLSKLALKCTCPINMIYAVTNIIMDDVHLAHPRASDLQNSLNNLSNYCNKWGLEVNTEKTKVVVFRKKGALRCNETWYYDDKRLGAVNDFHYLETTFSHTGSFSNNTKTLSNKALKALSLNSKTRSFDFETSTLLKLFDAFCWIDFILFM